MHAKSTGELISFGFSDRSVRSLVSAKRSANRWVQTTIKLKRLHVLAYLRSQSEIRTRRKIWSKKWNDPLTRARDHVRLGGGGYLGGGSYLTYCDQKLLQHCAVWEVTADWHELMNTPAHYAAMRWRADRYWTRGAASSHAIASVTCTMPSPHSQPHTVSY